MYDKEAEQAVDELRKSDGVTPLSKAEQYQRLKRFAVRQKLSPIETDEKAFVRYITKDSCGKALYKSFVATKGASVPTAATEADVTKAAPNEAYQALQALAQKIRDAHPELGLSKSGAISLAMQTPQGAKLALLERQARLRVA